MGISAILAVALLCAIVILIIGIKRKNKILKVTGSLLIVFVVVAIYFIVKAIGTM